MHINENGVLTDQFEIHRGVKLGCPLSAALDVLAMNPLIKNIKADMSLSGNKTRSGERVVALAYAQDVTFIVKKQNELNQIFKHLKNIRRKCLVPN